jgi:BarA-like signal transduction histidine kinase
MTTGKLGSALILPNTDQVLYTVPTDSVASVKINILNTTNIEVNIRLAICTTVTPTVADWVEYDMAVSPNSSKIKSGYVLSTAEKIIVRTSYSGVVVRVNGYED